MSQHQEQQEQQRPSAPRRSRPPEPIQCRRRWRHFHRTDRADGFTLMSYNTLADSLLWDNRYLYYHAPPECLSWHYRKFRLINEIRRYQTDIACLQEIDKYGFFARELGKHGYAGQFLGRTGDKPDGLAIFFKVDRFDLAGVHEVRFKLSEAKTAVMNRDNVALVAVLTQRSTGRTVCVANTHLLYNHKRGDVKLGQLCMLLAELHRLAHDQPLVLCGDFNMLPRSPLHELLRTGHLPLDGLQRDLLSGQARFLTPQIYEQWLSGQLVAPKFTLDPHSFPPPELSRLSLDCVWRDDDDSIASLEAEGAARHVRHQLQLKSVYEGEDRHGNDCVTTWQRSSTKATVDYIFHNQRLRALSRLELIPLADIEHLGGLPNHWMISDHLPLVTRLDFA